MIPFVVALALATPNTAVPAAVPASSIAAQADRIDLMADPRAAEQAYRALARDAMAAHDPALADAVLVKVAVARYVYRDDDTARLVALRVLNDDAATVPTKGLAREILDLVNRRDSASFPVFHNSNFPSGDNFERIIARLEVKNHLR